MNDDALIQKILTAADATEADPAWAELPAGQWIERRAQQLTDSVRAEIAGFENMKGHDDVQN